MPDLSRRMCFSPRVWTVGWLLSTALAHAVAAAGQERPASFIGLPGVFQLSQAGDRVQAHAGLLPAANGFLQHIYTEPNGTASGVFVANDGPHVYNAWATAHGDRYAPQRWADYRTAVAAEAVARAKADLATRGLVTTVVQNYYTLVAAVRKMSSAQQSLGEAQQFLDITQRQERGGEVARVFSARSPRRK